MPQIVELPETRRSSRIHFIPEWAISRQMKQSDIVKRMDVDKSTVSKWFGGVLPSQSHIEKLAALFSIEPQALFRHPDDDALSKYFMSRSEDERKRMLAMLEAAFPLHDRQ